MSTPLLIFFVMFFFSSNYTYVTTKLAFESFRKFLKTEFKFASFSKMKLKFVSLQIVYS